MLSAALKFGRTASGLPTRTGLAKRSYEQSPDYKVRHSLTWPPQYDIRDHKKIKYLIDHTNWPVANERQDSSSLDRVNNTRSARWRKVMEKSRTSPESVVEAFEKEYDPDTPVPPFLMNKVIVSYGKLQLGLRVLDVVVREVEKGQLKLRPTHLTSLLGALSRSGDLESVMVLYHLMLPHGIRSVTLITMLDGLARSGHIELIMRLWKDWHQTRTELPILNLYTTIAEATIKSGRFDAWLEAETQAKKDYEEAKASRKLSQIAIAQLTPKHCMYVSQLLIKKWVSSLRLIMPEEERTNITQELQRWVAIRPALPGSPLKDAEITAWNDLIEAITIINQKYGTLDQQDFVLEQEPVKNLGEPDFWLNDDDMEIERHDARILAAVDAVKQRVASKPL